MQSIFELYQRRETPKGFGELHDLLQPMLAEVAHAIQLDQAFVVLVDVERGILEGVVGTFVPESLLDELPPVVIPTLRSGKPIQVDDALRDPRLPAPLREQCLEFGMLSFAAVPLLPASAVLVVTKENSIDDAEIAEIFPYASRLAATIAQRRAVRNVEEAGENNAIVKEWLWWMLNALQDPVLLSDDENRVILNNVHAERLFVSKPDDSVGKRYAIELNNVLLSAALSRFTLEQGATLGRELTLVDPIEGNELLFEMICSPATNLKTGQTGLVSVLKDVTDLHRATEEVKRSLAELQAAGDQAQRERDRLNLILKNVADPIVVTDQTGQIILMNERAERVFQGSDEVAGRAQTQYLSNAAKLSSFLSQLRLEATPVRRGEIQLVDPPTEETVTLGVTSTEVTDALGQVTAVISVLHDLTELRELERRRVEQQLFESEKLAAVGRLAAAVAHEINNPLEAIKNALYLVLSSTPAEDPNRRFLEIASKETDRMSGIIRQMLGFYRPTSQKVSIDVNRVIEETLALLQRPLRQHRVNVHFEPDAQLPLVLASPDQLKQVFLNLLLNAREAMPHGGSLHIVTRLSRETDTEFLAGRYILVQIRDTGSGISEEQLPHIFEPFYSTKGEARGTGLGLWVSLGIIQDHGGQIKVRSRPGRGTTFTIALPPEGEC